MHSLNNSAQVKEMVEEMMETGINLKQIGKRIKYTSGSLSSIIAGRSGMSAKKFAHFLLVYNSVIKTNDQLNNNKRLELLEKQVDAKL